MAGRLQCFLRAYKAWLQDIEQSRAAKRRTIRWTCALCCIVEACIVALERDEM